MSNEGHHWNGEFGQGAGRTHICVKYIKCPHCGSAEGVLCKGKLGLNLGTHYMRRKYYYNSRMREKRNRTGHLILAQ